VRTAAERVALRSRAVAIGALAVLTLLAWTYLLSGAGMGSMAGMEGPPAVPGWPIVAGMWAAMMVAMMLPSAAPAILLYGTVHRHSASTRSNPPTAAFLAGYVACWLVFSAIAASLQQAIQMGHLANRNVAAGLLVGAGIYQLSPIKDACLRRCRSPAQFLSRYYRPGAWGALRLGLLHGVYCVGCCWLLMALLFVGGVMNLAWVAALTGLVAAEKLLPGGRWIAQIAGAGFIGWGAYLFAA
jgi:predicted metal-binding membrane protein